MPEATNLFPVPFAGIDHTLEVDDVRLHEAISALLICGHDHNFAVELGAGVDRNVIWVSGMGAKCLTEALLS